MANYYTDYSFSFKVSDKQIEWLESRSIEEDDPRHFRFNFRIMDGGKVGQRIWFYSFGDDCPMDSLCELSDMLMEYLDHFDDDSVIPIDFASTASRPLAGAFGGGIYIVTKDAVHSWGNVMELMRWEKEREEVA